ncbi:hypothetical protein ACFU6S_16665 [Streptomyces sp. NPDC057456]|uniref:hypothetical protein n=1 Tax=Streptomyces sp. NPDC057456 TaxID=3346139 RepID=UPI0036909EBF
MVGSSHDALHRIFQKDPALLTRALQQVLGIPFPAPYDFAGMNVDLTEIEPVERRVDTLESLAAALRTIDRDSAAVLVQFVDSCLADDQVRQMWRDLMTAMLYFWRHPLAQEVREEGREEGRVRERAEMTLRILEWRGITVPEDVRARVEACTDSDQLAVWSERAVHATGAAQLFDATE